MRLSFDRRRLIALVLLALAFLTLFLDFTALSDSAFRQLGLMPGLSNVGDVLSGVLQSSMSSGDYGDASAYSFAGKLIRALDSGGLSVMETRSLLSFFKRLARIEGESYPELNTALVICTILIALTFFAFALALYGILRRGPGGLFWFTIMLLVLLIAEIITVVKLNSEIKFEALVITAWPFIGLASAIASCVLCATSQSNAGSRAAFADDVMNAVQVGKRFGRAMRQGASRAAAGAASFMRTNTWTCQRCGKTSEASARFCSACGAQRPEKAYCPKCGSECANDAAFCASCGARLSSDSAEPERPQPYVTYEPKTYGPVRPQSFEPFRPQSYEPIRPQTYEPTVEPAPQAQAQPDFNRTEDAKDDTHTVRIISDAVQHFIPLTIRVFQDRIGLMREFKLNLEDSLTIGRNPACGLQINDETVSGFHLRVRRDQGSIYVSDLHSTNGSILNGNPLVDEATLGLNDILIIGRTRLSIAW